MKSLFVIDASGYLYRSYFAIKNITNPQGESTNALFGFIRSLIKLSKDFNPQYLIAIFDGPRNAKKRKELYADYKAHRSEMPSDLLYQIEWAREFCSLRGIPYLSIPEVEADDTMGSVARWAKDYMDMVYLCTSDKDMCQLVNDKVKILNTHKENLIIGPEEVLTTYGVSSSQMIDLLAITGDASDNVPGIPGIGPKTAGALLQQFGSLDRILENISLIPGKKQQTILENKDKALLSKRLVTIDTSVPIPLDIDFYQIGEIKLQELKSFYSAMGFNSLLKELENAQTNTLAASPLKKQAVYHLIEDEPSFRTLLEFLSQQKEIGFNVVTTDFRPIQSKLLGLGFTVSQKECWYIPIHGRVPQETVLTEMKSLFENSKIHFYGHDVKYALHVLENEGIQIANVSFDVGLASYLLNSHNRQHSLEALYLQYFEKVKPPLSDLLGKGKTACPIMEIPHDKMCTYFCEEVNYISQLKEILQPELKKRNLESLFYDLELPLLRVLARMERRGIFLDKESLASTLKEVTSQIEVLESEIYQMAGEKFNLNSPKQISEILFTKLKIKPLKKTQTGLSTNADVLESLKNEYPIAGKILEYRTVEKLRSTYLETLPNEVYPKTGRIHCTFNQTVAATGRLSCQEPNLQNIPTRTESGSKIRQAFRPEKKDWNYLAADYSQIELRLLAHLSEDPSLIRAFQSHEDIHRSTAALIFDLPIDQVSKEQRHQAKAVNFGIIYGQQAFGLAQELNIEVKDAAAFIDAYFQKYGKVKQFLESCKEKARTTGRAVTLMGRERLIPEIHSKNSQLRALAERLAVNTPFQGTAADLIKLAMIQLDKILTQEKKIGYMVLQIHDELIFEVPDFEIPFFFATVRQVMEEVMMLKVPLVVDITLGKNWQEC